MNLRFRLKVDLLPLTSPQSFLDLVRHGNLTPMLTWASILFSHRQHTTLHRGRPSTKVTSVLGPDEVPLPLCFVPRSWCGTIFDAWCCPRLVHAPIPISMLLPVAPQLQSLDALPLLHPALVMNTIVYHIRYDHGQNRHREMRFGCDLLRVGTPRKKYPQKPSC